MVNQLLAGVHIAAACEAVALAAKLGLDLPTVYEVITASAGNSWMFENRMPHVLAGDYTPLSSVEIFVKDLGIIQDMARTQKFPVPVSAAALQMFLMTAASGNVPGPRRAGPALPFISRLCLGRFHAPHEGLRAYRETQFCSPSSTPCI